MYLASSRLFCSTNKVFSNKQKIYVFECFLKSQKHLITITVREMRLVCCLFFLLTLFWTHVLGTCTIRIAYTKIKLSQRPVGWVYSVQRVLQSYTEITSYDSRKGVVIRLVVRVWCNCRGHFLEEGSLYGRQVRVRAVYNYTYGV